MLDAFRIADDILRQGTQGITDLITIPGLINLDFADVRSIMKDSGSAMMGIGIASGENRAADAATQAISSKLLESSIVGADRILFSITGNSEMGLAEISEASDIINSAADENANIIFGTVIDDSMDDAIRVTVIATGFDGMEKQPQMPLNAPANPLYSAPQAGAQRARYAEPAPEPNVDSMFDDDIPDFLKRNRY